MNQERAVGIAVLLVVLALAYTAYVSHDSVEKFHKTRGEEIHLKLRPPPGPRLLNASSPTSVKSTRPSPSLVAVTPSPTPAVRPDFSTACSFVKYLRAPGNPAEADRSIFEYLAESWPRDDSLELFRALENYDGDAVEELARTSNLPEAESIGLLNRLQMIDYGYANERRKDKATWMPPAEAKDFDDVAAMRARDPDNAFWALTEADLLHRQGRETERAAVLSEAASLPTYQNPISSFYSELFRTALEQGDDSKVLALQLYYGRAPILYDHFTKDLMNDAGKSAEMDESLKWIGKTMELSQLPDSPFASPSSATDVLEGNFMDAWLGKVLSRKATGDRSPQKTAYENLRTQFASTELAVGAGFPDGGCDEEAIHADFEKMRERLKSRGKR
jgi:hypothetical protein